MIRGLKCPKGAPFPVGTENDWEACAIKCPRPCLPIPIIHSLKLDSEPSEWRGNGAITITGLLGCEAEWYLLNTQGACVEAKSLLAASRGTAVHEWVEKTNRWRTEHLGEKRFVTSIETIYGPVRIGGKIDHYDTRERILYDWKTTSEFAVKYLPKDDHAEQLSDYAWLMRRNGIFPKAGRLSYWTDTGIRTFDTELMSDEEIQPMIERQVTTLYGLWKGEIKLEDITPAGPKMYNGKKCAKYCSVNDKCPFYRR